MLSLTSMQPEHFRGFVGGSIHARTLLALAILLMNSRHAYPRTGSCENYSELRRAGHINLGVRLETANPILREQFRYAMDFWAGVLDMDWHLDESSHCAIRVVDGLPAEFAADDLAQADVPDVNSFRGEIAFNPAFVLTPSEAYLISIHEIGHLLGLEHNPSKRSIMHAIDLETADSLEPADIAALSARHRVRSIFVPSDASLALLPRMAVLKQAQAREVPSAQSYYPVQASRQTTPEQAKVQALKIPGPEN